MKELPDTANHLAMLFLKFIYYLHFNSSFLSVYHGLFVVYNHSTMGKKWGNGPVFYDFCFLSL